MNEIHQKKMQKFHKIVLLRMCSKKSLAHMHQEYKIVHRNIGHNGKEIEHQMLT